VGVMKEYDTIKKNFETCGMLLIDKKQVNHLIQKIEEQQKEIERLEKENEKLKDSKFKLIEKTLPFVPDPNGIAKLKINFT
jgi:hypothetical protein